VETHKADKKTEKNAHTSSENPSVKAPEFMIEDVLKEISKERVQQDHHDEERKDHLRNEIESEPQNFTKESTGDLFERMSANQEILDLNRKLAEQRSGSSIGERLQKQRIESLKGVIGLNDRFQFVKDLFDGDAKKYEDVIYTLNNFKKLDEALQYFSTLKYRFNWDEEQDAYEKLTQMIERKYNLRNVSYT